MIKINLLNTFKDSAAGGSSGYASSAAFASDDDEKRKIIIECLKRVAILVIGPLGLYVYDMQTLPVLAEQLRETQAKFEELKKFNDSKQGLAEEIKKYEIEQARFMAQTDFINKIDRDKVNEFRLFEHLKNSTPENLWLNKLELIGSSLIINVESVSAKEIEKFIQRLSNAEFVSNLTPINQTNKKNYADTDTSTTLMTIKAQLVSGGLTK